MAHGTAAPTSLIPADTRNLNTHTPQRPLKVLKHEEVGRQKCGEGEHSAGGQWRRSHRAAGKGVEKGSMWDIPLQQTSGHQSPQIAASFGEGVLGCCPHRPPLSLSQLPPPH